jgi:hypothetical protein
MGLFGDYSNVLPRHGEDPTVEVVALDEDWQGKALEVAEAYWSPPQNQEGTRCF